MISLARRQRLGAYLLGAALAVPLVLARVPAARAGGDAPAAATQPGKRVLVAREGKSFLEEIDGQRVLHLEGDFYEMGRAHGLLLKQETRETIDAYVKVFALGVAHHTLEQLRDVYAKALPYIPKEYQDEMRGLADGAGVPLEEVQIAHIVPELHHCSGAAVFGKMTRDGKLYHYRSLDYSLQLGSKKKVQDDACLIVRKPTKGYATVVVGWAGTLGCVTGMSAEGISIGEMGSSSLAESFTGTPMWFRVRWILENCRSLDEACEGFRGWKRTCGYNFIVTDGKIPDARAVELDQDRVAFFAPGGAEENVAPHFAIPFAVRRVNHFVDPELAGRQRRPYDPRESAHNSWIGYSRISEYLQANAGKLDGEGMIALCRGYPKEHSCLHQAVFCPTDLRFWVANAKDPAVCPLPGAQNQTFFPYDLGALLKTDPATLEGKPGEKPKTEGTSAPAAPAGDREVAAEKARVERALADLQRARDTLKTALGAEQEFRTALERLADILEHADGYVQGKRSASPSEARDLVAEMQKARESSEALRSKLDALAKGVEKIPDKIDPLDPKDMGDVVPVPEPGPAPAATDPRVFALLGGEPSGTAHEPALPTGPAADGDPLARAFKFLGVPAADFAYRLEEKRRLETYTQHALRFPSAAHTRDPSDVVTGFYYEPARAAKGRVPGVVVVHHLGGGMEAEKVMAAYFAQHGLAAVTIALPGYRERRAPGQPRSGFVGNADPKDDLVGMRQAILDVCRAGDFLRSRPEVDPARVGIVGVSLGAIVAADAAGFDPRFSRAVFVIGGGDLFSVIANDSPETHGQLERAHAHGYTDELLKTGFELVDPVTFAPRLRSSDVLMLNAEKDEIIPRASTLALWRKAGYPRIKWYACGHYGIVAHLPDALNEALDHLEGRAPRREPD